MTLVLKINGSEQRIACGHGEWKKGLHGLGEHAGSTHRGERRLDRWRHLCRQNVLIRNALYRDAAAEVYRRSGPLRDGVVSGGWVADAGWVLDRQNRMILRRKQLETRRSKKRLVCSATERKKPIPREPHEALARLQVSGP